jgi:hypothetical protein
VRILDAACDVAVSRDSAGVDGSGNLIEVAADRPHAVGEQAEHHAILVPRNGRTPAPSIDSDRTKAETVIPAALAAASSALNSAGEKRTCATLSFRFDASEMLRTIVSGTSDRCGCGRGPADRGPVPRSSGKMYHIFPYPANTNDSDLYNINTTSQIFHIYMIVFFHIRVFLYRCESTSTRSWIHV